MVLNKTQKQSCNEKGSYFVIYGPPKNKRKEKKYLKIFSKFQLKKQIKNACCLFTWVENEADFEQGDLCEGQAQSLEAWRQLKDVLDDAGVNVGQGLGEGEALEVGHHDTAVLQVHPVVDGQEPLLHVTSCRKKERGHF